MSTKRLALIAALGVIASVLVIAQGCAQLMQLQGNASTHAAYGVAQYCKNTDETFRTRFTEEVNAKAKPNTIAITCN